MEIRLLSSDDVEFRLPKGAVDKSATIKHMLEDFGDQGEAIPLPNVKGDVLAKIVTYLRHCADHPAPPPPTTTTEGGSNTTTPTSAEDRRELVPSPWEDDFCSVDRVMLFELILAANYLDIKPLLDLTCQRVANMIKGKSPEEIRKEFNIKNGNLKRRLFFKK